MLLGKPKFGFRFAATETPKGHRPARQKTTQQPEVPPEVTMGGGCGFKCPHSLTGPREPCTWLPLFTWDLERDLLVYLSSQQNDIQQSSVASDFAAQCDPSLMPFNILSRHTMQLHLDFAACNVADVHGMLTSSDYAPW